MIRGHVVSWGEHEAHGPLSLKREIRELDRKMDLAVRRHPRCQEEVARLEDLVRESETLKARLAFRSAGSRKGDAEYGPPRPLARRGFRSRAQRLQGGDG